jgi:Second Messenger Oligonucleotide or Dinucleotide Synthetase domain
MGGGGGGLEPVSREDPEWLRSIRSVDREKYEAVTNELLKEISTDLGGRDEEAIHRHVEILKDRLENDIAGIIDVEFGGSLRKHTYVDGVSDVDALVLLNRSDTQDATSRDLLEDMANVVRNRLPDTEVRVGGMAVTVRYADGVELQLLPAIKRGNRIQVPGGRYGDWSPVADPSRFADELRSVNARNSMSVVPVIKLFKAMQDAKLPESARLSGYHVEALAVDAFRRYNGPFERKAMLEHLVDRAAVGVLEPIKDTTGQSKHVDDHLGPPHSHTRQITAAYLHRLRSRMDAADKSGDTESWVDLVGRE